MTTHTAPPAARFSSELRTRTAGAHSHAETSPFLAALVGGHLTRDGVAALLRRLLPVYAALEQRALGFAGHPDVDPVLLEDLVRTPRLLADLEHLGSPRDTASPAAAAYARRVDAAVTPQAFLAHHYTRLLGDLSGGQVMRAALTRSLGLVDGAGASFLSFPGIVPATVKGAYRDHLDGLRWDEAQQQECVAEVREAYRLNAALTAELDAALPSWTLS